MSRRHEVRAIGLLAIGALAAVVWLATREQHSVFATADLAASTTTDGARVVAEAFEAHRSGVQVELSARVARLLPDDDEGDRHQRFLLELPDGLSLLVAHNIDLAPRVPVSEGEEVRVHGEYEWNEKGGVLHWTHRNPARDPRHPGGWIEAGGRRYD